MPGGIGVPSGRSVGRRLERFEIKSGSKGRRRPVWQWSVDGEGPHRLREPRHQEEWRPNEANQRPKLHTFTEHNA